jgi:hypothetical protein
MARLGSKSLLLNCREFLRGLRARFHVRGFGSGRSCQSISRQNYQCQDAQFESIPLAKAVRTENLYWELQLRKIPSTQVPNRRRKFQMYRKAERNSAKASFQMIAANVLAILLQDPEAATCCHHAELSPLVPLAVTRTHRPILLACDSYRSDSNPRKGWYPLVRERCFIGTLGHLVRHQTSVSESRFSPTCFASSSARRASSRREAGTRISTYRPWRAKYRSVK